MPAVMEPPIQEKHPQVETRERSTYELRCLCGRLIRTHTKDIVTCSCGAILINQWGEE